MGIELEYKLGVNSPARLAEILSSPIITARQNEPFRRYTMSTTYYDTPTLELSARRWTLRLREENNIRVATCKTPTGGRTKNEWNAEAPDLSVALPLLTADGAPQELLTFSGFTPLCGASFTRNAANLQLDGAVCEISGDIGVVTAGDRTAPICELELELKSGSEAVLASFAVELMAAFGLQELMLSKFARAKALREETT